uniref:Uncharacterized protein n=1 Tax=Macrostomum lignano TaxID=282301 RepID=A0A1I8IZC3_9PLAT
MADPNAVLADIGVFKREQMNHVEVAGEVVLPDREQVESEKREPASVRRSRAALIGSFKHVEVQERCRLPMLSRSLRRKLRPPPQPPPTELRSSNRNRLNPLMVSRALLTNLYEYECKSLLKLL